FGRDLTQGSIIDLASSAATISIYGARTGDRLGTSLATGNVGSAIGASAFDQSLPDILAGAPGSGGESGTQTNSGAAYLWYGRSSLAFAQQVIDLSITSADATIYGETGTALGSSVAIGDIDGDGTGDLLLGAPSATRSASGIIAAAQTGAAYAIFGGTGLHPADDPTAIFDIGSATPSLRPPQNLSFFGSADGDQFGSAIAAGDVTGDGLVDLLVGAPNANGPAASRPAAGEAYVFAGSPSLSSAARLDVAVNAEALRVYGSNAGDRLGQFVGAGRYTVPANTSRTLGLLLGAPFAQGLKGTLSLVFGGSSLTATSTRDLNLNQEDLRVVGQNAGDELGSAAASGNLDGQNGFDLAVASPFASPELRSQAGSAYILLSHTALANVPPSVTISANPKSGAAPLLVNFSSVVTDTESAISSYSWSFGDGGTATTVSPSHTYAANGQYTARLTVADSLGESGTAQTVITVGTPSGISVHINPSTT
ncbi:MAG: PKD domain-containing protein, partial [Blastocatellia bacterium]